VLASAIKAESACASIGAIGCIIAGITACSGLEGVSLISSASVLASTVKAESASTSVCTIGSIVASVTTLLGGDGAHEKKGGKGKSEDLSHINI